MNTFSELRKHTPEYISSVVSEIERVSPETVAEFKQIQHEHYQVFCLKHYDYGPNNITTGEDINTDTGKRIALSALIFRLNDKVQRLKHLILVKLQLETANESVSDSFLDISNFGIIAEIVKRGVWGK
jgi:hypothetical protein